MSDKAEILFLNESFYSCFSLGNLAGMDDLWAKSVPVSCIHPGWESLTGRETVINSWRKIIGSSSTDIRCLDPRVFLYGDTGLVLCYEEVEGRYLIATNIFSRENGVWKMVHHQAGPTRGIPEGSLQDNDQNSIN